MGDFENMVLTLATGEECSVRRFAVHEALSQPFEVNLVVESKSWTIELEPNVGQKAQFQLTTVAKAEQVRIWAGVCSHLAQLQAEPSGNSTYLVRVVPKLWLLSQRRGHRIFQRKTLPEIVVELLGEWKIKPQLQLTNEYLKHDYVVQYGETDLAFVTRLCERAGITYYFDFAGMKCELVLSDAPHLSPPRGGPPLPWSDKPQEVALAEWVSRVVVSYSVRPGHYAIRDFEFRRKPDFELIGKAEPAPAPESFYEQYHYEPGEMKRLDPPDGIGSWPVHDDKGKLRHSMKEAERMAKERLRGERFGRRAFHFETNCADIAPGIILSIDDHPRTDLTPADLLLVSSSRLEGVVGQKWTFTSEAVLADEPYHPPMVTPRPTIDGVQSAIVVGPPGEEVYTDEFGRVRVQFHWDRDGKYDDNSSCWMRVSQDWAGAGFGSVLIPRIGQEVLVAFLDGNPDQPMVVGRVYNAKLKVPYKLPDFKTRSGWKSDSMPGSNGFNEILMEDAAGEEIVYHQAQRDMQKLTKRSEIERVHENHIVVIGKERQHVVNTVQATMVGGVSVKQMISPPSKEDLKILPQQVPDVSPLDTTMEMIANRVIFTTGKATVAFDGKNIQFEADGNITLVAKGGDVIMESNRCFINTMPPPPAPKPSPVQKVEPGVFQSQQGKMVKPPPPPPEAPEGDSAEAMVAHRVGAPTPSPKIAAPSATRPGMTSKVGVPGVPDKIPRLPNLPPKQAEAQERFAEMYERHAEKLAQIYNDRVKKGLIGDKDGKTFATDDAKLLSKDYNPTTGSDADKLAARGHMNLATHNTAAAIAKRAFLKRLDELAADPNANKTVLVTGGGVGAGKSYGLKARPELKEKAGAVWDAAGEANSTEMPWVIEESKKRGLNTEIVYVHQVPDASWQNMDYGVIPRGMKNGRMVDARLHADSYAEGARNFDAVQKLYADDPSVKFNVIDVTKNPPEAIQSLPKSALELDPDVQAAKNIGFLKSQPELPEHVQAGGYQIGDKVWGGG